MGVPARIATSVLAGVLAACQGQILEPSGPGGAGTTGPSGPGVDAGTNPTPTGPDPCATRSVGPQPLLRISSTQYRRVLTSLFGPQAALLQGGALFPPTVITHGFRNDADANTVNTAQSNAIEDEAERIAAVILADPEPYLRALLPCTLPATVGDPEVAACVDAFIDDFGPRAYRRPLTAAERNIVRGLYDGLAADQGATRAWVALIQFFVQSPALLYRVERGGSPVDGRPGLIHLTPDEVATRLSFLFLGAPPDEPLRQAAAAGLLGTKEEVAGQAMRLMQDPRFAEVLAEFHHDWLHLYEAARGKDPLIFPEYTEAVAQSLADEPGAFVRAVLEGEGTLAALLSAEQIPVDATTARYYGVAAPSAAWRPTAVTGRRGILTLASVQAALGKADASSPIHRGNFIRSSVLCAPQLVLPANVDIATPLAGTSGAPTAKERLAPLLTRSDCAGCHQQINPIGFAFENYDGAGGYRRSENGATIDASGTVDVGQGPVPFRDATELATLFANSRTVERCYALQWFRAANGRVETPDDTCSVAELREAFRVSGGDLPGLLLAVTQTDAFLYRRAEAP